MAGMGPAPTSATTSKPAAMSYLPSARVLLLFVYLGPRRQRDGHAGGRGVCRRTGIRQPLIRAIGLVRQADGLQLVERLVLLPLCDPRAELSSGGDAPSERERVRTRAPSSLDVAREAARSDGCRRLDGRAGVLRRDASPGRVNCDGIDDGVLERLREIDGPCRSRVKPPPPTGSLRISARFVAPSGTPRRRRRRSRRGCAHDRRHRDLFRMDNGSRCPGLGAPLHEDQLVGGTGGRAGRVVLVGREVQTRHRLELSGSSGEASALCCVAHAFVSRPASSMPREVGDLLLAQRIMPAVAGLISPILAHVGRCSSDQRAPPNDRPDGEPLRDGIAVRPCCSSK